MILFVFVQVQVSVGLGLLSESLGYFATVIANSGEVYGRWPPSTKLEKLTRSEFSRGTFENNVSEFFRYNSDSPEFTELVVQYESLPKILEELKTNKALN